MRTLGLIPARAGSKRLPGKNLMELQGKPLIMWTLDAALMSELDEVWVSTDSGEVRELASQFCQVIHRPPTLAQDGTPMSDVLTHALKHAMGFDRVMLLQPTSPLRNHHHINTCLRLGRSVVSVREEGTGYQRNGAVYLMDTSVKEMLFDLCYVMTQDESVDIDTMEDFKRAEKILGRRGRAL